jgi:translation initiation factor 5A
MNDDGDTKDDVKVPDGEVGEKIRRLFVEEEKDTSKRPLRPTCLIMQLANVHPSDVVILTAMGEQAAVEAKEAPQKA